MKGIILHGGHGTRLRPLTHTGPKQLLPIANKPMSQYALEDLKQAGVSEIGIVTGDAYPGKVKEYYGDGQKFGVRITYIHQDRPAGISHAIGLCRDFVGDDRFIVYLGDNVLRKSIDGYARRFSGSEQQLDAMVLLCEVDDPGRFGIAELDGGEHHLGMIKKITEKPKSPASNLAVIGIYFLSPKIFDVIDDLRPSWRGELEITDALDLSLRRGQKIGYDTVTGWWKDTGTPEDVIHANKLVLGSIGTENQFLIDSDATVNDGIVLGRGTTVSRDSLVTGPVIVGRNCHIGPAARIGPDVSIGDNCRIKNCDIKNSIVMPDCTVDSRIEIDSSIIAQGSVVEPARSGSAHRFLLGERSHLQL